VLLAALALAVDRWAGLERFLVDLESHGRDAPFDDVDLSRTVGWFTTFYPVLLDATQAASPGEALAMAAAARQGIPAQGFHYTVLRYLAGGALAEQLGAMPEAQILFNYLGQFDQQSGETAILAAAKERMGPGRGPRNRRSHLLSVDSLVAGGVLQVNWGFSEAVYAPARIAALADHYQDALDALLAFCASGQRVPALLHADETLEHDALAGIVSELQQADAEDDEWDDLLAVLNSASSDNASEINL